MRRPCKRLSGNDVQWTHTESCSVRQSVCAKLARDKLTHCKILCRTFDDSCCCTFVNKNFVIPLSIIQLSIEDDPKMQNVFSDEIVGRYSFRLCCCCGLRSGRLDWTQPTQLCATFIREKNFKFGNALEVS